LKEQAESDMPGIASTRERKTILALGWISFFMDVSSEMIYPLLPVFLESVLGVGSLTIGVVAGLSESTASFFRVLSGAISDKFKKRKAGLLFGYSLSTLSRPVLALASSWGHVLIFRLIDRAGKGVRTPPRDALIADASTPATYGRRYGFQRAMDTAGAVLGPALASVIMLLGAGYRSVFWLSIIPAAIAVTIIQVFVKEPSKEAAVHALKSESPKSGKFTREMKLFLLVTAVFSLGNSSNFFLVLRAQNLGFKAGIIPLLYMSMNVTYALLSYPAGRLADRFGKARMTFLGYFIYAVIYASFAATGSSKALWILFPLQGIYLAFTDGVSTAYMATLLSPERRATGFAFYYTVIGLALLPASTVGGWLWDRFSPEYTFIVGAVLSLMAGVLFWMLLMRGRIRRAP
jgi:MFS family permease